MENYVTMVQEVVDVGVVCVETEIGGTTLVWRRDKATGKVYRAARIQRFKDMPPQAQDLARMHRQACAVFERRKSNGTRNNGGSAVLL